MSEKRSSQKKHFPFPTYFIYLCLALHLALQEIELHYIMREFTEFEKECIKSFIDVESTRRVIDACYIYAQLMGSEVRIDFENGILYYYTDKIDFLPLAQAELKLTDITLLFQYLEKSGYLVFTNTENYAAINAPKTNASCKKIFLKKWCV